MNGGHSKQMPRCETDRYLENLGMNRSGESNGGVETGSVQHESDSESLPSNSPSSSILLGGTGSATSSTNSTSRSSCSTSSGRCCSGSITEEEGDDGCLDDWEAVADALAADDKQEIERNNNKRENLSLGSTSEHGPSPQPGLNEGSDLRNSKTECPRIVQKTMGSSRAWRADDAFRPQSLPYLSKQMSFPVTDRHFGQRAVPTVRSSAFMAPSSCPICFEDLDFTDSSFLPCSCGFRLCLFCHKRILEEDARCPGCRKPYEHAPMEAEARIEGGSLTFRLSRSCSMIERA